MNKEISTMYQDLLKIQEKNPSYTLQTKNEVFPNYYLMKNNQQMKWLQREDDNIIQIFDSWITDHNAQNLIFNSIACLEHKKQLLNNQKLPYSEFEDLCSRYQNKVMNLMMLLLENDPSLYTALKRAFYEYKCNVKGPFKDMVVWFEHEVDGIQVGIKEKEYKTPFYNVIETEEEQ